MTTCAGALLEARLSVAYRDGTEVLRDLRLTIGQGELLGLAGQSGSGKSTLALALMGLLDRRKAEVRGSIRFQDSELVGLGEKQWRSIRGRQISFIFQSAIASLTPTMRLGDQIREAWQVHSAEPGRWLEESSSVLQDLGLPPTREFLRLYPDQISVGMAQRFLAAMAVLHRPALLIADEPTSALDVLTQSELLELLGRLNQSFGTSILLITHDLRVAASFCHRIAVLHGGTIVEDGPAASLLRDPCDEYTKRLVAAIGRWPEAPAPK
jgi:ABC-type dipeptide/oligopeptide/nickel transport system ATPase component